MQNTLVIVAGDCEFGFERAGGAAVVIEHNLVADLRYIWAQFKFSVASSRGANQRWCIHDTGRTECPQCHAAVL